MQPQDNQSLPSRATREHRYRCAQGHEWTTRPNVAGHPMSCPHCNTITLGRLKPLPDVEERLAAVIWQWNTEHPLGPPEGYPYERLVGPTKNDLRKLARRMLPMLEASNE
jgi:hypothetical protein